MARFGVNNRQAGVQQAVASTSKSQVAIEAATGTLCRGQIVDIEVGADGPPNATDCNMVWDCSRVTTAGTMTTATPSGVNPADVASRSTGLVNATVEPTTGVSLMAISLNQRASFRWWAAPGSELIWPATNLNGLAVRALSPTYVGNALASVLFDDL